MRKLSKYKKETIINWNEAENLASIYTFNEMCIRDRSCGASFPVSREKLLDRKCFVTSFRQGSYTPLRRLCVYPLWLSLIHI